MTDSIAFYLDRNDSVHVFNPEALPNSVYTDTAQELGIAVLHAGYQGVIVDAENLSSGKVFSGWNFNMATPEGKVLRKVFTDAVAGLPPPSKNEVLAEIVRLYAAAENAQDR